MAFTYSGDPRASDRDRIRFELVDTDARAPKFSDEEIELALDSSGAEGSRDWRAAASTLATRFARQLASQADVKVGALTIDFKRQSEEWRAIAEEFALDSGSGGPSAPDEDLSVPPTFGKGMHDNGGGGYPPPGSRYYP